MSNGGYKGASPARETSPEQYPGVWELTEQFQAQADGNWPFQADDNAPKSLRLNSADSAYLSRTPVAAGNRKTWTWSGWIKRSAIANHTIFGAGGTVNYEQYALNINEAWGSSLYDGAGSDGYSASPDGFLRDVSAWYHIVVAFDTTQATASDRIKLYLNGELQVNTSSTYPAQNYEGEVNNTTAHTIGRHPNTSQYYTDGYLAEIHFIDGQALSCDAFGFFDGQGIWQPKRFTGDYSNGPVYSNNSTGGAFHGSGSWAQAFDGKLTTGPFTYSSTSNTLTLPPGVTWKNKIRVYALRYGGVFKINGTDVTSGLTTTPAWKDLTATLGSSGSLSTIEIGDVGTNYVKLFAVELDDVILTDASVGRNSFHLDFSDSSSNAALGKDSSGLGNSWTPNNLDHFTGIDPTVPANTYENRTLGYYLNGNPPLFLTVEPTGTNGINRADQITHGSNTGTTFAVNDVLQWAIDWSGGTAKIWFGRNNTWYSGDPAAGTDPAVSSVSDMNLFLALAYNSPDFELQVPASPSYTMPTGFSYWGGVTLGTWKTSGTNQGACPDVFSTAIPRTGKVYIEGIIKGGTSTYACIGLQNHGETARETDIFVDTPVNGKEASTGAGGQRRGNYCTWNPLVGTGAFTAGNLRYAGASNWKTTDGTISVSSGKWYFEATYTGGQYGSNQGNLATGIGFKKLGVQLAEGSNQEPVNTALFRESTLAFYNNGYFSDLGTHASVRGQISDGDVIGVSIDYDNGTYEFFVNNSSAASGSLKYTGALIPWTQAYYSTDYFDCNFGQRSFVYTKTGYSPLATSFLPEPTIKRGDEAMDVALWQGNGTSQTIGNLRLSPDLVWIKNRDGGYNHVLFDTVRGTGGTKVLFSNRTTAEGGGTGEEGDTYGHVSSFNDDGFTVANGTGTPLWVSNNGDSYVGWAWDAGNATTTIAAGGLNSSAYDQSQTWSNSLSASFRSSEPATNAFDGDTSTIAGSAGSITYTSPVAVASSSTIRVIVHGGDHDVSVNGGANQTVAAGSFVTLNFTNPTNNTFTITFDRVASGADTGVRAIEIGGRLLVDNGVSVTNVPSIASTVRANPAAGFSIVNHVGTGAAGTFGHGLNAAPEFLIFKNRDATDNWFVWSKAADGTATTGGVLNNINQFFTGSANELNSTLPTSSVISVGNNLATNGNNQDIITYAFAPVDQYSSFGSFEGNGSANGPFVYLGFRPAFLLLRLIEGANSSWKIYDSSRDPDNPIVKQLYANSSDAEPSDDIRCDFLSNGFKIRTAGSEDNYNNNTLIYAAFAEHPFASNCRAR